MTHSKVKVLYIAGWGRSGSTLLARILAQVSGFVHMGELRTLWTDGLKPKGICGCGVLVRDCQVWQEVFDRGFGGMGEIDPKAMAQLRLSTEPRSQEILLAPLAPLWPKRQHQRHTRLQDYISVLSHLYPAIQATTQAQIIVDDSLHPGYAYTLSLVPNLELYLVHLVRDPRGCAYSWQKRQKQGLGTYTLSQSAFGWALRNLSIEVLRTCPSIQFLRLRYEDFVQNPPVAIRKILKQVGLESQPLPFVSDFEVNIGPTHSVFGNSNRMMTGLTEIRSDQVWKTKMSQLDKLKVVSLTWPFLAKYGYLR
jgi:hypothetical protein